MNHRDWALMGLTGTLIIAGFFALASASLGLLDDARTPLHVLSRQFILAFSIGIAGLWAADRIPLRWLRQAAFWIFCVAFLATLAVFIPSVGFEYGGARRWIAFGAVFFQPAEFLKIGFMVYLAAWIASRSFEVRSFEFGVLPLLGMIGALSALFIAQPDIGTLGVMVFAGIALFYVGGARLRHVGVVGALVAAALVLAVLWKPYALDRILVFLDSSFDPQGAGYHVRQAAIAFGAGGIWGRGFGESAQKFFHLPEPTGDAIFAVIGEEFGFAGTTLLVFLFMLFFWLVVNMVRGVRDPFARLLGLGIGILITSQAFINMGALVGILPLTGITLPFISHGGSSLVATLTSVGLLFNISKHR